jgi:hypothetical protein
MHLFEDGLGYEAGLHPIPYTLHPKPSLSLAGVRAKPWCLLTTWKRLSLSPYLGGVSVAVARAPVPSPAPCDPLATPL